MTGSGIYVRQMIISMCDGVGVCFFLDKWERGLNFDFVVFPLVFWAS